jgi:hypothetical protein
MFIFRFLKSNNQVVPDGGSLPDTNFAGKVEKFVVSQELLVLGKI